MSHSPGAAESRSEPTARAGGERLRLDRLAFCVLWVTGPDTTLDGVFRVRLLRPGRGGEGAGFDRFCRPFSDRGAGGGERGPGERAAGERAPGERSLRDGRDGDGRDGDGRDGDGRRDGGRGDGGLDDGGSDCDGLDERTRREFGLAPEALAGAAPLAEVWAELLEELGDDPLVVSDAEAFASWFGALSPAGRAAPPTIGLGELAALCFPGRLASRGEALVRELAGPTAPAGRGHGPEDLLAATRALARRFLEQETEVVALAAHGWSRALGGLRASEPGAARRLELALALLDRPEAWMAAGAGADAGGDTDTDTDAGRGLRRGALGAALADATEPEVLLDELEPRCAVVARGLDGLDPLPPATQEPAPFVAADLATLDAVFRTHLPAAFAARAAAPGAAPRVRAGQHAVAREVARALGDEELLLVHAPTGTGKTLAYLVPALLWSSRHGVRVGIATYTRALQEQAMDQEVPRALAALRAAGVTEPLRVGLLKGRENYLCWRALKLHVPGPDDEPDAWLAWTALALFALTDPEGDLDRFPRRAPVALVDARGFRRRVQDLVGHVRSQSGCCRSQPDRRTCAAEVARRRAERSHVVITNHSFALFRQEFFRRMVFDECEHLHDQAHNAWSCTLSIRQAWDALDRVHQPERASSRAPLDRVLGAAVPGTASHDAARAAADEWQEVLTALGTLEHEIGVFDRWRREVSRARSQPEEHSLLREYFDEPERAAPLLDVRVRVVATGARLDAALAEVAERLEHLPVRGKPRLRRSLELARGDLVELLEGVEAWLPVREGEPSFRPETFYDVERDARNEWVLAARVLLPNEYLARNYYPRLQSGVFLSATTWLRRGFESARGYLGLDRAVVWDEEDRPVPRDVRTFRAPEVFDYRRVLVAVPHDAPKLPERKADFLDYVRRFVGYLGERTRGRMLVLFTNAGDVKRVGRDLEGFFRARRIPLWWQNMPGTAKEELSDLFRGRTDSVLLGVDTFWYGADFPGETLEHLVVVRLPYGVPDHYHHAQCAALGVGPQRARIYLPRALAKFRQGFGRLMRKESDRGCVYLLDARLCDPRHRAFLDELPLGADGARFVRGTTDRCLAEAFAHVGLAADLARRGLTEPFEEGGTVEPAAAAEPLRTQTLADLRRRFDDRASGERARLDVQADDLPF